MNYIHDPLESIRCKYIKWNAMHTILKYVIRAAQFTPEDLSYFALQKSLYI